MSWRAHNTGKPRRQRSITQAGAPRRAPVDWEGKEQAIVIRWLLAEKMRGSRVGDLYDVIYHVPNGGHRHKKTAGDLKKQGVKAGVSDLVVMSGRGGWYGLYLEFKATPPRHAALAESQRDWLAQAELGNYCAALARGFEEAKAVLREYAAWQPTERGCEKQTMTNGTEWRKDDGRSTGTDEAAGE